MADATQIYLHMRYSDFGDIISAIDGLEHGAARRLPKHRVRTGDWPRRIRHSLATSPISCYDFSASDLLTSFLGTWLSLAAASTFAVAAVSWARATLAGPVAALGLLVLDGVITARVPALRHVSPAQQIALLVPDWSLMSTLNFQGIWFERMTHISSFSGSGSTQVFEAIPSWRAALVLAAWAVAATVVAIAGLRARDLPS